MGKLIANVITLILLLWASETAFALRCGDNLISIGDKKNDVLLKCGTPCSRGIIGYSDNVEKDHKIKTVKIEHWIVKVNNYGISYYYSLIFEGNKLTKIKPAGTREVN